MDTTRIIEEHRSEKESSRRFKERRLAQWNETYLLYRDRVATNRLTQRQPVNIPIIRDTIQNWLSKIDEDPSLSFETRGSTHRDRDKEIILNEIWQFTYEDQKLDLVDNLDKKVVGLQGRSFKYLFVQAGKIKVAVVDPYDIDIDPRANPLDINSARFFNHKHIFVPLRAILANKTYLMAGKQALKQYIDSREGVIAAKQAGEEEAMRRQRLEALGANNFDDYKAKDVMVELNRSYKLVWHADENRFVRHLIVIALDSVVLYNQPSKKAIGIDFLPFSSWASDPDINDIWSDGIADNVRTMNKVVNMYFSQDLENRTYRNFGMYFYDTLNGTFQPRAFEAKPFGMYGVPGKPEDIIKQMKIEPLADTMQAIEYVKNLIQSSVAQTPTERGVREEGDTTLGEVELSLQQSQTRQQVVAKQYRASWADCGRIFYGLLDNMAGGRFKLFKKAADGTYASKTVTRNDWHSPEGYECKVVLRSEREATDDMELRKTAYVKSSFAQNPAAQKIAKRKELEIINWSEEEINEVMQVEEQMSRPAPAALPPGAAPSPVPVDSAAPVMAETGLTPATV